MELTFSSGSLNFVYETYAVWSDLKPAGLRFFRSHQAMELYIVEVKVSDGFFDGEFPELQHRHPHMDLIP